MHSLHESGQSGKMHARIASALLRAKAAMHHEQLCKTASPAHSCLNKTAVIAQKTRAGSVCSSKCSRMSWSEKTNIQGQALPVSHSIGMTMYSQLHIVLARTSFLLAQVRCSLGILCLVGADPTVLNRL